MTTSPKPKPKRKKRSAESYKAARRPSAAVRDADGMLPAERLFADEYIKTHNATKAMAAIGRTGKTHNTRVRYLKNPAVAAFIKRKLDEHTRAAGLDVEFVVSRLMTHADQDMRKMFRPDGTLKPIIEMDDATASVISKFEQTQQTVRDDDGKPVVLAQISKVGRTDPIRALEALGKYMRMFDPDRISPIQAPPEPINIRDEAEASRVYQKILNG